MKYRDFDIRISAGSHGGYLVRAESESQGEADAVIHLDPDSEAISGFLQLIAQRDTDINFLQLVGHRLYQELFAEKAEAIFQRSMGEAAGDPDLGLRLRLRIAPPELAALPWELLFSDFDSAFIGTRTETPLVRYLELPTYKRSLATHFPLRVLVAIPKGSKPELAVDADAEKAVLQQAFEDMGERVEVTYLHERFADRRVSWQRILEQLSQQEYHCFHFIGHGTFHQHQGHLLLDGADGNDDIVSDTRFAELFVNAPSTKLVLLNACKGATLSSTQPLAGTAARLVEQGVPAVVAMQFSIYDTAAVDFARSFYHSLFSSRDKGRVDVAVTRGRHILKVRYQDQRELAAPVLFMHTANGMLFVPESGNFLADLPKSKEELHTLEAASEATDSEQEAARYLRRIKIAKRSVQFGLLAAMLIFFASWISLLDLFRLDTSTEFVVMALGNAIADHPLDEDLRIVTIDGEGLDTIGKRDAVATVLGDLATVGAKVIVLDLFYSSENGGFARQPQAGEALVQLIENLPATVKVISGANEREGTKLEAPHSLISAVDNRLGHGCHEMKLGLTRSLPVYVRPVNGDNTDLIYSLALSAYAAHREAAIHLDQASGGLVATQPEGVVSFQLSELHGISNERGNCGILRPGDQVAQRFIRMTPLQSLQAISSSAEELRQEALKPMAERGQQWSGKLVLVGMVNAGDTVHDRSGERDGVFWQADAINNLLANQTIVPMKAAWQLLIMIVLAAVAAALRLLTGGRKILGINLLLLLSAAVFVLSVYIYGRHGILINPAYHILALWFAWWLTGKAGKSWLL